MTSRCGGLSSESGPVGALQLVAGLTEQLCSTAVQFSLVLQPGHKSFYFPQARAPVLYTAHHLIKESKVTGLVKVILPLHVQQRLINTVASRLSAYAANPALGFHAKQTGVRGPDFINCFFSCGSKSFISVLYGISVSVLKLISTFYRVGQVPPDFLGSWDQLGGRDQVGPK